MSEKQEGWSLLEESERDGSGKGRPQWAPAASDFALGVNLRHWAYTEHPQVFHV